jgi:NADPH-dependent 2,4-dienoyl-CoA reductase/sulfur reductase-like enzyme
VTERLIVIGGDAAGMSAASQARRLRGPDRLDIAAFEAGNFTSYSACGIPYFVGTVVDDVDRLVVRTPEEFRARQSIDAHIRHEVTEIDLEKGAVRVCDRDAGRERWAGYDKLLVATGAVPIRPDLPGGEARGVFGVQTLDHGTAIDKAMREWKPSHAVVVGGGYIGLEMAEAFQALKLDVTLVEKAPQVMPTLDPDMAGLVADAARGFGITVRTGDGVRGFEERHGRVSAVVTESGRLPAGIVVLGLGVRPNVELARAAGLEIGDAGGVRVDRRMRASHDNVWSAGDCAEKWHRIAGEWRSIALGTHANKEGRVAGINIAGGYAAFPGVVGTAVTKVCEVEVARTGLSEREARAAGFDTVSAVVDSTSRAGYFPGATAITTKLIAESGTGRLLGGQIVGREGAAKRVDVLAAALWNGMTVDEVLNLDLGYAPPFSPVWDPVLVAARRAAREVARDRRGETAE